MKYRLMAVDLDGTLLNSENNLTEDTRKAIKFAVENGTIFTICTGRAIQGVLELNDSIGFDMPFITYNGAMIVMGKSLEILYEQRMSAEDARTIYNLGEEYNTTIIVWTDNKLYVNRLNERSLQYGRWNNIEPILIEDVVDVVKNGVTKMLWFDDVEVIEEFKREAMKTISISVNCHTSKPEFLEFVDVKASKGNALKRLIEHLGIKQNETISVGNGDNDISMIEFAGVGVVMGNAKEYIKERADYITLSNDEDGVAHVIYKFLEGSK